ncbi:MAG: hypothetical protein EPN43_02590 [Jatrophihabitans sp.]|nr:MAG: hypothetical protein EPN43_02590 [Jatrophihabitans sp.]
MSWVAWLWIAVVVVAAVILAFCCYEVRWKAMRLTGDLQRLQALSARAQDLRTQAAAAQQRLAQPRAE